MIELPVRWVALLMVLSSLSACATKSLGCLPVGADVRTIRSTDHVTLADRRLMKKLAGTIGDWNGEPVEGVLVEVFRTPERASHTLAESGAIGKRVAACYSREGGWFQFAELPDGDYLVRVSGPTPEFRVQSAIVGIVGRTRPGSETHRKLRFTVHSAL